jgi:energy-coupling factor transport system substrate-specific component
MFVEPALLARTGRRRHGEILAVWGNTRMVVLTAISAALYAALLIPFKLLPLIPGVTELRPGNAVPIVCSLLFGPAGAWGAAIGNLIGDFFGGFGPGALVGFAANFVYGLLPYKLWRALQLGAPVPRTGRGWLAFTTIVATAAASCALIVGCGLDLLGFVPFGALANIVFVNNFVMAAVLAPLLLRVLHPRVKEAGLCYDDVLVAAPLRSPLRRWLAVGLAVFAALGGLMAGDLAAAGWLQAPHWLAADGASLAQISLVVSPFFALLGLALLLL